MGDVDMNGLGIPQDRIEKGLGVPQQTISDHLPKMPALANPVNSARTKTVFLANLCVR
ncbi:MAG: hypothetical protein H8E19_00375 [Deltaproteobacteria bacterium]|uniref:Uncharacterized protein n=1 Tax=Candidatus Desulfacyla euxinica TaxID=2841693 RepID=A0A8J6MUW3_9DELT|nr:hypothetical protein [Candidatus Desulfacyla euxinica]